MRRHLGDKKNNGKEADIILRGKYQPSSQAPFWGDWEQGNIFYDVTFIRSAVCSLRSAVCSLQMSYTGLAPCDRKRRQKPCNHFCKVNDSDQDDDDNNRVVDKKW